MNIAFWILVVAALGAVWFLCVPIFRSFGRFLLDFFTNAKSKMADDNAAQNIKNERTEDKNVQ